MFTAFLQKKSNRLLLTILVLSAIFYAYSNHFNNSFQFDDAHTIEENNAIKSLDIKSYFTDGRTFSALPLNQSYRPLTTLENAIDYAIVGKLDPKPFHVHIFITFLLICLLIYVLVKQLIGKQNSIYAIICMAMFGLLCANAETVNYIIQRAEITSSIAIVLGLIFYIKGGLFRKFHLYLLFPFIGFFAKEMAFVFAPLLFLYILIFEENADLHHFYKKLEFKKCLVALKKTLPAIIFTAAFLVFYAKMLPPSFTSGGLNKFEYLITQPWVICHYIVTYFVPYNLSADTDWVTFKSITDYRAIIGRIVVLGLIWLALKTAKNEKTRLFSFGLLWFFIALIPTSSIVPFAEVMNDHRAFIPYIGLTISVVFGIKYLIQKFAPNLLSKKLGKVFIFCLVISFLGANAFGIHQRNKVWKTEESLWKDVTIKSPKNGRGMMNYGLALMTKGDYANAEIYFNKAAELNPYYSYVYINLGILKNATGDKVAAEQNFKYASELEPNLHNSWYYYADFLINEHRYQEAIECLLKVQEISPNFLNTNNYLLQAYNNLGVSYFNAVQYDKAILCYNRALALNPNYELAANNLANANKFKSEFENIKTDQEKADFYLNLSLELYNQGLYLKCIDASQKSNEFVPSANAFNNICTAYNQLQEYVKAVKACQEAIKLDPSHQLAKVTLSFALQQVEK